MAENLRCAGAAQRIGFFLHTPFPSFGVLAVLPHYKNLLEWLCAYDLVGYQSIDDLTAFHDAIVRGASGEVLADGRARAFGRTIRAGVFPIGVDTEAIAEKAGPAVKSRTLRRFEESLRDRRLIIARYAPHPLRGARACRGSVPMLVQAHLLRFPIWQGRWPANRLASVAWVSWRSCMQDGMRKSPPPPGNRGRCRPRQSDIASASTVPKVP
jgi:hypothetical protein